MSSNVESRKSFLINLLFFASILAIVYCFFKYLFWVAAPFLLSFFFAVILQRPIRWLDKRTKKKHHTLVSMLVVVVFLIILVGPVAGILAACVNEIAGFIKYITDQLNDLPSFLATLENEILNFLHFLPNSIYNNVSESVTSFFTNLINDFDLSAIGINMESIKSGVVSGISGAVYVVKNIPSALIAIVIGIIALIFFTKDYDYIVRFIQKQFPESKKNLLVEIKQVFSKTILKMFRAYGLIMLITFFELFIGFSILTMLGIMNNSYYAVISVGIAIFDILPVAGSGGILIPWAVISLIMGNYQQAIGIMVIYIAISIIRQYIEPKIVGNSLGVHPIITLMGLYFGLKLFGFIGMFIVPICVMTLKAFNDTGRIQLWKTIDRN